MFERIKTDPPVSNSNRILYKKTMPKKRPFSMHQIDDLLNSETSNNMTSERSTVKSNDSTGSTNKRIKLCINDNSNKGSNSKENGNSNSILDLYKWQRFELSFKILLTSIIKTQYFILESLIILSQICDDIIYVIIETIYDNLKMTW